MNLSALAPNSAKAMALLRTLVWAALFFALLSGASPAPAASDRAQACGSGFSAFGQKAHYWKSAESLVHSLKENGGFTFNPALGGHVDGKSFIAVNVYPERSLILPAASFDLNKVRQYLIRNSDLIGDPRISLGGWHNPENNNIYLDLVLTLPSQSPAERDFALELGKKFNQIGVFDLKSKTFIHTQGDGSARSGLPPIFERSRLAP